MSELGRVICENDRVQSEGDQMRRGRRRRRGQDVPPHLLLHGQVPSGQGRIFSLPTSKFYCAEICLGRVRFLRILLQKSTPRLCKFA